MRIDKALWPLILVGLLGLAVMLFLSGPASTWIAQWVAPESEPGALVGRLMEVNGTGKCVHEGRVIRFKGPLSTPLELFSGDRLETDKNSDATIVLNSQEEMRLQPLTAVNLQLWNEKNPGSAVYLTVLAGDVDQVKAGARGRTYVVRSGRLYLPGQKTSKKAIALTVLKSAPLDMELADPQFASDEQDSMAEQSQEPTDSSLEPETLSNEYIGGVIALREAYFQKCWLSRLKDNPNLKGQLTVQLEISSRGKVKSAKVSDSELHDSELENCVISVMERLSFRSFRGSEIQVSYPITFE